MKNFLRLSVLAMMLALLAGCSKDEPEKGDGGEGGDNGGNTPGPVYEEAQVNSDLWTATDPLGRKLPDYEQAGTKKPCSTGRGTTPTWSVTVRSEIFPKF